MSFPLIGKAQQLPQFTQYMFNTISINPAYAGSREALNITALHRSQWAGFEGVPQTQARSLHSPLRNEKVGLGFSLINDKIGDQNFAYIFGDFSYTIRTGVNTELAFGLKGGFSHYNLDQATVSQDNTLENINSWTPNLGAGIYLHSDMWYLGLSAPRFINQKYHDATDVLIEANERVSYYLTGGYVFNLNKNLKFKPSTIFKLTNGAPASYDVTANFLINEKLWLGAAYRFNDADSFGAIADFQVSDQFRIGYAYDYPKGDIRPYTSGSHEIILIYELKFIKSKLKSPRYF